MTNALIKPSKSVNATFDAVMRRIRNICYGFACCVIMLTCNSKSKDEWGIIQEVQGDPSLFPEDGWAILRKRNYIVLVTRDEGERVAVLLNPSHEDEYRQIPEHISLKFDSMSISKILAEGRVHPKFELILRKKWERHR